MAVMIVLLTLPDLVRDSGLLVLDDSTAAIGALLKF